MTTLTLNIEGSNSLTLSVGAGTTQGITIEYANLFINYIGE